MATPVATLMDRAFGRVGLDKPGVYVGSTLVDPQQMLDLAQEEGEELAKARDWSVLTVEGATITLVAGQESYPLPADFDRIVAGTSWDRTNRWPTFGPDTAQTARYRRESIGGNISPRRALRQSGTNLLVWPVPEEAGDIISFDYVSSSWLVSGGAPGSTILTDADTILLAENVFVFGLKYRWLMAKGLDYTMPFQDYERAVSLAFSGDQGGGRTLSMSSRRLMGEANCDDVVADSHVTAVLGTSDGAAIGVD